MPFLWNETKYFRDVTELHLNHQMLRNTDAETTQSYKIIYKLI